MAVGVPRGWLWGCLVQVKLEKLCRTLQTERAAAAVKLATSLDPASGAAATPPAAAAPDAHDESRMAETHAEGGRGGRGGLKRPVGPLKATAD